MPPAAPINTDQYGDSVDHVVASVDGDPITEYDVQNPNRGMGGANSLVASNGGAAGLDQDAILKQLVAQQLLRNEAQKYSERVDASDVDRYIQTIEDRDHITDAQLRAQIQSHGMTYEAFRKSIFQQVEAITMIDREIRQKIQIPDSQIQAYYKDHPAEFSVTEEKYQLAQILIAVPEGASPDQVAAAQKKAESVRAQALKGKDFGELAREYSDDDSKSKGGELGEFTPGDLNDQIKAGVDETKVGDITRLIHTKYGFHIIKVEAHQQPGEQPLTAVREQIRDKLLNDEAKTRFNQWVDQDLAKQHDVEIMN